MHSIPKPLPDLATLNRFFHYDGETGNLIWKVSKGRAKASSIAGRIASDGYVRILVNYEAYQAHRIIWKMVKGQDPCQGIDHIDGDKTNNRVENFREATNSQNRANVGIQRNNQSGAKGVTFDKKFGKWNAYIQKDSKQSYIGRYTSLEAASLAYQEAAKRMHGEYFRAS